MTKNSNNYFTGALQNAFGADKLAKIEQVTIGIAGAGGLGSNCAVNLVRSGFSKFVIVDFDHIEYSNLNRQFYFYQQVGRAKVEVLQENLRQINPDVQVEIHQEKIEDHNMIGLFGQCQVVVEAFDQAHYKKMLVEQYSNGDKFLVAASGIAGWGKSDEIKTHKINEKFYIIGDLSSKVSQEVPPCAPRVAIAAAKQADLILEYVLKGG